MWIKCDISAELEWNESSDDFWECEVVVEMLEIADSIDDARGIDLGDRRMVVLVKRDEMVEVGEGGGEFARGVVCGDGDDTFRKGP